MDRLHRILHREVHNISERMHTRSAGALVRDMSREDMLAKMDALEQRAEQSWISHQATPLDETNIFAGALDIPRRILLSEQMQNKEIKGIINNVFKYIGKTFNSICEMFPMQFLVSKLRVDEKRLKNETWVESVSSLRSILSDSVLYIQICSVRKVDQKFSSCAMSVTHWLLNVASWKRKYKDFEVQSVFDWIFEVDWFTCRFFLAFEQRVCRLVNVWTGLKRGCSVTGSLQRVLVIFWANTVHARWGISIARAGVGAWWKKITLHLLLLVANELTKMLMEEVAPSSFASGGDRLFVHFNSFSIFFSLGDLTATA